jgi:DNA-binding response OmpR family regulator
MKKKILLVDDEKDMIKSMTFRLEDAGYEVIVAEDGPQALEKTKRERPDLILLDLMLPKMNGYKVCALLKSNAKYRHIPIIIFTARANEADRKLSKEVGADAYITKLFEPEELFATIRALLKEQ